MNLTCGTLWKSLTNHNICWHKFFLINGTVRWFFFFTGTKSKVIVAENLSVLALFKLLIKLDYSIPIYLSLNGSKKTVTEQVSAINIKKYFSFFHIRLWHFCSILFLTFYEWSTSITSPSMFCFLDTVIILLNLCLSVLEFLFKLDTTLRWIAKQTWLCMLDISLLLIWVGKLQKRLVTCFKSNEKTNLRCHVIIKDAIQLKCPHHKVWLFNIAILSPRRYHGLRCN